MEQPWYENPNSLGIAYGGTAAPAGMQGLTLLGDDGTLATEIISPNERLYTITDLGLVSGDNAFQTLEAQVLAQAGGAIDGASPNAGPTGGATYPGALVPAENVGVLDGIMSALGAGMTAATRTLFGTPAAPTSVYPGGVAPSSISPMTLLVIGGGLLFLLSSRKKR